MILSEKEKIKRLKQAVKEGDNEVVHGRYDELIEDRLTELDPKFMKKLNSMVKGIGFWYA